MKKGFTLIELLAVIVILAIIAIIAVPMVLNVIEKAKEGSAVDSAYGYIHAIEQGVTLREIKDKEMVSNGEYTNLREFESNNNITLKGSKPSSGTFTLEKRRVVSAELIINGYRVICDKKTCRTSGKADKITITYDLDGGTLSKSQDIIYKGDTLTLPVPEKANYGFEGWYIGDIKVNNETVFTENVTLKAKYKRNKWTITFNAGDGALEESSILVNHNETTELPIPTPPANYSFAGWYTESNGNGDKITNSTTITNNINVYAYYVKTVTNFAYTGGVQSFVVPVTGKYKIELWGAQGGNSTYGGKGAYVKGEIIINKSSNPNLYIHVGGNGYSNSGYNGGGVPVNKSFYGGGSTDVRLENGAWDSIAGLRSRIIIAAGGSGAANSTQISDYSMLNIGAHAGGLTGYPGNYNHYNCDGRSQPIVTPAQGGSQTTAGQGAVCSNHSCKHGSSNSASFGVGARDATTNDPYYAGGGGGGYYGGGGGVTTNCNITSSAGGSSYISGHTGSVAITSATDQTPKSGCTTGTTDNECSKHYSGLFFTNTKMIDGAGYAWTNAKGSYELMPNPSGGTYSQGVGHSGNGYAKITYIGE